MGKLHQSFPNHILCYMRVHHEMFITLPTIDKTLFLSLSLTCKMTTNEDHGLEILRTRVQIPVTSITLGNLTQECVDVSLNSHSLS